ncbi:MAG: DUF4263 domain-containing protein [Chitinophagaceae bacterium]|nr:DUF4263 domain-containing protein [Chitinophagaceae bacterium]
MPLEPNQENRTQKSHSKEVYHYYNSEGKPIFKTKEIARDKIIFYPYTVNRALDIAKPKRIKTVEFRGWKTIGAIPKIFRKKPGYGFKFESSTQFWNLLYKKFSNLEKVIVTTTGPTRFSNKTITFNWNDLSKIVRVLKKESELYKLSRKHLVHEILSEQNKKVKKLERILKAGELEDYLSKFTSYEKMSVNDIDSLTQILSDLPTAKITATAHIIKTKEKLDTIYLEDIIEEFDQLMKTKPADEEAWQKFFEQHTWTLTHLFPYEVILRKGKAYVGGKTLENEEGRVVDFLFENGFKDNFALLEIKPPSKALLKNHAYREPDVYPVSDELSGGVNQCLDQKDSFLRQYGLKYQSLDPKAILVIGRKTGLNTNQSKCFELYRANQKNVDVVTYDELRAKLKGLHDVITGKVKK